MSTGVIVPPLVYAGAGAGAAPMGIAFPPRSWRGERRFGAREGVVVDAGHQGTKGVWRFDLEAGTASRLSSGAAELDDPVDVAFTQEDIFVLNRAAEGGPTRSSRGDYVSRVLRLVGGRLASCGTDRPIVDPCGLAWGRAPGELYVLCGHRGLTGAEGRCLLRLQAVKGSPGFTVTPVMDGFHLPSDAGVDVSHDGSQMVITEARPDGMVILWRFGRAPARPVALAVLSRS